MNMIKQVENDPRDALFDALDNTRAGMLGLEGSTQHMQPMTHFADPKSDALWFISSKQTDLARALGTGSKAEFVVTTPSGDFHASLTGTLSLSGDREKLDEIWSAVASAWFEDGREDPDVALLRFDLAEAAIWASVNNGLVFGFEIARANLDDDHQPDLGNHRIVTFEGH